MSRRFNPPPNWPQPPLNWNPEPGWKPDPHWGPPPDGWELWVDENDAPSPTGPTELPPQRIFLSYRRSDCQSQANGLHDGLRFRLPDAKVFMDIDAIPPGVDFEEHIRAEIEVCDLVLVMIGDNWLDRRPDSGTRRIDEPNDFVRLEIEAGFLSPRCTLIPVLVEGADMPRAEDLPESIRKLARINAIELSDQRWTSDLARLSEHLETRRNEALQIATRQRTTETSGYTSAGSSESASPTDIEHPERRSGRAKVNPAPPSAEPVVPLPPTPPPWAPPPPYVKAGSRSTKVGWWMVAVAFVTCGLGAFAPAIWAVTQRRGDAKFRKSALVLAAVITVVSLVGLVLLGSAPTDSKGNATGVASNVGLAMLLICLVAATALGIYAVVTDTNRKKRVGAD